MSQRIVPCLWFDDQAETAARFYSETFPGGRIVAVSHYPESFDNPAGKPRGSVLTVELEIAGQRFTALNGGPIFVINPSISFFVRVDRPEEAERLFDPYGVSWQIVPEAISSWMATDNVAARDRAFQKMLGMKKLDIAELQAAFDGA